MIIPNKDAVRFWSNVDIKGEDDCWIWKLSAAPNGYGKFSLKHICYGTHRVAWILAFGDIPPGKFILHKCDNKPCCNPKHLYCGTQSDNMCDRWERSGLTIKEVSHPRFYEGEIWLMKKIHETGKFSQEFIAKLFKTGQSSISRHVRNKYQVPYKEGVNG